MSEKLQPNLLKIFLDGFAIGRATGPQGQQSPLHLIAAITDPPLIRRILSYLKLSPTPPPIEPARWAQAPFAWTSP